jgi:hypothetical protein
MRDFSSILLSNPQHELGDVMAETILVGRGTTIAAIPREHWEHELRSAPEHISRRLEFMSRDHHRVRNFVVRELPRLGRPISLDEISIALQLDHNQTTNIVEDLEKHLFFLVRGNGEEVSWAFPVTADATGHHLVFSTGERLDAA